jgi:CheY-like chemotaxis protein
MLLIDDNLLFLVALEGILIASGNDWRTVKAMNGREALVELEGQTFDLIVTDYEMPGMNGLELLAAVRQKLPETPVIMLTGDDSNELREKAHHLGVFCVLEKPVPGRLFLKTVREATGHGPPQTQDECWPEMYKRSLSLSSNVVG